MKKKKIKHNIKQTIESALKKIGDLIKNRLFFWNNGDKKKKNLSKNENDLDVLFKTAIAWLKKSVDDSDATPATVHILYIMGLDLYSDHINYLTDKIEIVQQKKNVVVSEVQQKISNKRTINNMSSLNKEKDLEFFYKKTTEAIQKDWDEVTCFEILCLNTKNVLILKMADVLKEHYYYKLNVVLEQKNIVSENKESAKNVLHTINSVTNKVNGKPKNFSNIKLGATLFSKSFKEALTVVKKKYSTFMQITWFQKIILVFTFFFGTFLYVFFSFFFPNFFILIILLKSISVLIKTYKDYQNKNVFYDQISLKSYDKGNFLKKICFLALFINSFFYKIYFSNYNFIKIKNIIRLCLQVNIPRILFISFTPNEAFWFCLCYYSIYLVNLQTIIQFKKIKKETWKYFYTIIPYESLIVLYDDLSKNAENQYYNENLRTGFFCFILLFSFFRLTILIPAFWLIVNKWLYFFIQ